MARAYGVFIDLIELDDRFVANGVFLTVDRLSDSNSV
jgi:hypothetical protein